MHKSRYNAPTINPHAVHPADQAKGEAAEQRFRAWLDASRLPHIYIDQTPISVPEHLRGKLKRPDYLVGVQGVGMVAFDVKAKSLFNGSLIFDLSEVRRMRTFARLFHLTVYFACLDPDGGSGSYWVRLDQLDFRHLVQRNGTQTVAVPVADALFVSMDQSFHTAFVDAVALS